MGILSRISEWFLDNDEEPEDDVVTCSVCGSTNLSHVSTLSNFSDVVLDSKTPVYDDVYICLDCGNRKGK